MKKYIQHRRDYMAREDKENRGSNKLIKKAEAAMKRSANAIAAEDNDDEEAERALDEAEGIVSEIERQLGK
jgi:hypothetical protein